MPELGALERLAELGIEDATIQRGDDGRLRAAGIGRVPVNLPELGAEPLWLQLPVQAEAAAGEGGELCFSVLPPDAEVLAEGQAYLRSLLARGELETTGKPTKPRATHEIVVDEQGRRCLRRRGFA